MFRNTSDLFRYLCCFTKNMDLVLFNLHTQALMLTQCQITKAKNIVGDEKYQECVMIWYVFKQCLNHSYDNNMAIWIFLIIRSS
jgi:hypothetical protein